MKYSFIYQPLSSPIDNPSLQELYIWYRTFLSLEIIVKEQIFFFFFVMHKKGYKQNEEGPEGLISCSGTWFCLLYCTKHSFSSPEPKRIFHILLLPLTLICSNVPFTSIPILYQLQNVLFLILSTQGRCRRKA